MRVMIKQKKIFLILVLIFGMLFNGCEAIIVAIAVPSYFEYVERGRASDAKSQIKILLEECKIWKTTHEDFPTDVQEMIDEGAYGISNSTLRRWNFDINLEMDYYTGEITGSIIATSTDQMDGGEGKIVCFDAETGQFGGYGQRLECAN